MFGRARRLGFAAAAVLMSAGVAALVMPQAAMAQSAPSAYPVQGIDTSHKNHSSSKQPGKLGPAINWTSVHNAGKKFVTMKATEGTSYVDPWFTTDFPAPRPA